MITISAGAALGIASILITLGGIIYHAGRLAARVESLEEWRAEVKALIGKIDMTVDELKAMFARERT